MEELTRYLGVDVSLQRCGNDIMNARVLQPMKTNSHSAEIELHPQLSVIEDNLVEA